MKHLGTILPLLVLSAGASLAQTGFSTRTYPAVLPRASDNTQILASDFNNDGRPDLLTYASRYGASTIPGNLFLNNGSGGFLPPAPLPGPKAMNFAQVVNVNGDAYSDIVGCANTGTGQTNYNGFDLLIYVNKGNGTFSYTPFSFPNGQCHGLTAGDVYQNGFTDVVVASSINNANNTVTNQVTILKNDGRGTFTPQTAQNVVLDDPTKSTDFTNCAAIGLVGSDFQQNGQFSLLLTSGCNSHQQYANLSAGTTFFGAANPSAANGSTYTFTKVASGYPTYSNGQVYQQSRGQAPNVVFTGTQPNGYNAVSYATNNGSSTFNGAPSFSFTTAYQGQIYTQAVGNLTADNFTDIALTEQGTAYANAPDQVTILAGSASGAFTKSQSFFLNGDGSLPGGIVTADFNGDGLTDIATLSGDPNDVYTTTLVIYTNTQTTGGASCNAPTGTNTNVICSPAQGATVQSPLTLTAASNVAGFTLNRLYLDNQSVYQVSSQSVNTSITAAAGTHTLVLVSYSNTGASFSSKTTFTVGPSSPAGCLPSAAGVSICAPTAGSTESSPVTITTGALAASGNITAIRAYIDNLAVFTTNNPTSSKSQQVSQAVSLTAGTHNLVVVGYESTGAALTSSETFTIAGLAPCYPSGAGAQICSPAQNASGSSPITLVAGATAGSGSITAIRVYVDNVTATLVNNPQQSKSYAIDTTLSVTPGKHNIVVVGYQSTGGSVTASDSITVQ